MKKINYMILALTCTVAKETRKEIIAEVVLRI
jgi:hypothetical protein